VGGSLADFLQALNLCFHGGTVKTKFHHLFEIFPGFIIPLKQRKSSRPVNVDKGVFGIKLGRFLLSLSTPQGYEFGSHREEADGGSEKVTAQADES